MAEIVNDFAAHRALEQIVNLTPLYPYSESPTVGAITLLREENGNVVPALVTGMEAGKVEQYVTPFGESQMTEKEFTEAAHHAIKATLAFYENVRDRRSDAAMKRLAELKRELRMQDTDISRSPLEYAQGQLQIVAATIG